MNKYNVRAVRTEFERCIRSASWKKFRSTFTSISRNAASCQAIVLHRPRTKGSDVHGSLLHAVLYKSNSRPPPGVDIIRSISSAVPQVLTVQDSKGRTPLHVAVDRCAPLEMIECLLAADEARRTIVITDKNGDTPLISAVKNLSDDVVDLLLRYDEEGKSLLVKSKKRGRSPLYYVASNELRFSGCQERSLPKSIGAMLVRTNDAIRKSRGRNGRRNSSLPTVDIAWKTEEYPKPLWNDKIEVRCKNDVVLGAAELLRAAIACAHMLGKFSAKVFELIIQDIESERNGDTKVFHNADGDGNFLLHIVCMEDNFGFDGVSSADNGSGFGVIQYLLEKYPSALKHPNSSGNLPLHLALQTGKKWDVIRMLLEIYPDAVQTYNDRGELPFHLAIKCGFYTRPFSVDVADELWRRYPGALTKTDASTRLYPFQLAACCENYGICASDYSVSFGERDEIEAGERTKDICKGAHACDKQRSPDEAAWPVVGYICDGSNTRKEDVVCLVYSYLRESPDVLLHFVS